MEVDFDSGIDYYPPILTKAKKKRKRIIEEEEDNEENSNKIRKEMKQIKIFKQLITELDECIERAFSNYYKSMLKEFKKFLNISTKESDLPTLILRGQCIQWNRLYQIIQSNYPHIELIKNEFEWDEEEIDAIFNQFEEKNLLIFLHANNLYNDATFKSIFSHIQDRGSTYLVLYTPTTFGNIYEHLPRQFTTKMNIKKAMFPPCGEFLRFLLDGQFPLGFMPQNCISFHGKTLAIAQQYFQCESRSLVGLSKILVLALHDFVFNNGVEIELEKREQFRETMNLYSTLLQGFADISNEDIFELHINIQSDPDYFQTFFEKTKIHWMGMIRDEWRIKFKELNGLIQNPLISEEMRSEYEKLFDSLKKQEKQLDDDENNPPKSKVSLDASTSTNSPGSIKQLMPIRMSKKSKLSTFFADQERKRVKMQNTLPKELCNKILAFMDSLFAKNISTLPSEFVAGPGDIISNCVVE